MKRIDLHTGVTWKERVPPQTRLVATESLKFLRAGDVIEVHEDGEFVYEIPLDNACGWVPTPREKPASPEAEKPKPKK